MSCFSDLFLRKHLINYNISKIKAVLFGLYYKVTQTEYSDIDIAIVIPNQYDLFEMQVQLMLLTREFSLDIEPHPIKDEDFSKQNPMAFEIMNTGIDLC